MINVTDKTFSTEVINSKIPVVVDLWAPWCKPCLAVAPTLDQLSRDLPAIKFVKLNIDDNEVAVNYNIMSIPTFLVFSGGQVVARHTGNASYHILRELALSGLK